MYLAKDLRAVLTAKAGTLALTRAVQGSLFSRRKT
jgi:hypothetical protein